MMRIGIAGSSKVAAVLGLALCILPVTRMLGDDAARQHGPIAWMSSFADARKTAAKQKKIMMIDFWAEWCGPCKQMLATTYQDKAVVERAKRFVPALIDVDKNVPFTRKYSVEAIPTVIFLDARGKVLLRNTGYATPAQFLKLMQEAEKKAKAS